MLTRPGTWVYAIGYHDTARGEGPIKVGLATNPNARVSSLQTGSHRKLYLYDAIPGGRMTERAFHEALKSLRIEREWFNRGDIVLFAMDGIRERMLDEAQERMWAAQTAGKALDDYYEEMVADPAMVRREVDHTIRYFDYVARTGDDNLEADNDVAVSLREESEAA